MKNDIGLFIQLVIWFHTMKFGGKIYNWCHAVNSSNPVRWFSCMQNVYKKAFEFFTIDSVVLQDVELSENHYDSIGRSDSSGQNPLPPSSY